MKFVAKIRKWGNSFVITIPMELVKEYNLKEDTYVKVELEVIE